MNIFYLHTNARKAAMMHCDKHCVKMILETAQMLCTAHRVLDGDARGDKLGLYRSVHQKHPSTLWVRASMSNYLWAYDLYMFLCQEFLARYGKQHNSRHLAGSLYLPPRNIANNVPFTHPPQCMPSQYKNPCTVTAYRQYYIGEKAYFARWKNSIVPDWWVPLKA